MVKNQILESLVVAVEREAGLLGLPEPIRSVKK